MNCKKDSMKWRSVYCSTQMYSNFYYITLRTLSITGIYVAPPNKMALFTGNLLMEKAAEGGNTHQLFNGTVHLLVSEETIIQFQIKSSTCTCTCRTCTLHIVYGFINTFRCCMKNRLDH